MCVCVCVYVRVCVCVRVIHIQADSAVIIDQNGFAQNVNNVQYANKSPPPPPPPPPPLKNV